MTASIISLGLATSVIDAFDEFENRLSSVCNQDNASKGMLSSENVSDDHAASSRPIFDTDRYKKSVDAYLSVNIR